MELIDSAPESGMESKADFLARLHKITLTLPKSYVKAVVQQMPTRVRASADSKGLFRRKTELRARDGVSESLRYETPTDQRP